MTPSESDSRPLDQRFAHGSFIDRSEAHTTEPTFGMSMEEAAVLVIRRAIANGCSCSPMLHIGAGCMELLHEPGCPRLRTLGANQ